MDEDIKYHFDLIRKEQSEESAEVCKRLENMESQISTFIKTAVLKPDINTIHDRITRCKEENDRSHIEMVEKITSIEKQLEHYRGQISILKLIGGVLAGLAIIIEPVIIWWVSRH